MARLTAPPLVQRMDEADRLARLAHDAKHAPAPASVECAGCGDAIHGGKGVEFKLYCDDCVDEAEWLAGAREHSAHLQETARG